MCREANTARGEAECCICLETPPEYCIFRTHKQGGALSVTLYFLVASGSERFSLTQTAAIFSDKDTSKCLTNLFLVVQRTNRISLASLASFSDLQCHARDQSCCLRVIHTLAYYGGNLPLLIKGRFYVDVFFVYKGKILPQCLLCVLNGKILHRVIDVKPNACNCIVCAF